MAPKLRKGHFLGYHDNFIILFGGKDGDNNILNDLWILNLSDKKWIQIEDKFVKQVPQKMYYHDGEIIDRHGKIFFFGGKKTSDKTITILNLNVLLDLYESYSNLKSNDKNITKLNLWNFVNAPGNLIN